MRRDWKGARDAGLENEVLPVSDCFESGTGSGGYEGHGGGLAQLAWAQQGRHFH
jgi:hypothetical protein